MSNRLLALTFFLVLLWAAFWLAFLPWAGEQWHSTETLEHFTQRIDELLIQGASGKLVLCDEGKCYLMIDKVTGECLYPIGWTIEELAPLIRDSFLHMYNENAEHVQRIDELEKQLQQRQYPNIILDPGDNIVWSDVDVVGCFNGHIGTEAKLGPGPCMVLRDGKWEEVH